MMCMQGGISKFCLSSISSISTEISVKISIIEISENPTKIKITNIKITEIYHTNFLKVKILFYLIDDAEEKIVVKCFMHTMRDSKSQERNLMYSNFQCNVPIIKCFAFQCNVIITAECT